jgi:Leu/Phe-tRNA-protein transferase
MKLVGGLYGIYLKKSTVESMLANVSKCFQIWIYYLCEITGREGVTLIDCQIYTEATIVRSS